MGAIQVISELTARIWMVLNPTTPILLVLNRLPSPLRIPTLLTPITLIILLRPQLHLLHRTLLHKIQTSRLEVLGQVPTALRLLIQLQLYFAFQFVEVALNEILSLDFLGRRSLVY